MKYILFGFNEHYNLYEFIGKFDSNDDALEYAYSSGIELYYVREE
jgi:hypothetical protein